MNGGRVHGALFVVLMAIALLVVRRPSSGRAPLQVHAASELVEILLPDASLLLTVDVSALARTRWGRALLDQLPRAMEGSPPCVQDQLARLTRIGVALPARRGDSTDVELGIVAEGPFEAEALVACATAAIRARRGTPSRSTLNGFDVVRDRTSTSELAARDGGPVILSGGAYFRDLVDRATRASDGDRGLAERLHLALREGAGSAPLLATWVLPPGWLARWLGDPDVADSPYSAIRALVLRSEPGDTLRASVQLSTESADAAARLEPYVRRLAPQLRALVASRSAEPAVISRRAEHVVIDLAFSGAELGALLDLTRALALGERVLPSHAVGSAHAEQVQPEAEHAAGRGAK